MRVLRWSLAGAGAACLLGLALVAAVAIFRASTTTPDGGKHPIAVFVGDSYTTGYYASRPETRWSTRVARAEGWVEVNLGRPGTGYTASTVAAQCGWYACPAYSAMIPAIRQIHPPIVIVAGGLNDGRFATSSAESGAIWRFYSSLRSALPHAEIIAVGPNYVGTGANQPFALKQDADVKRSAQRVGARYVDMLHPNVLAPADVYSDGIHPNDDGHAAIAARVLTSLRAAK